MSSFLPASLILVRHGPVAERYQGICYGRSDVELGAEGERQSREVAEQLAAGQPTKIVHSGLERTRYLAERLGEQLGLPTTSSAAIQERDFGTWELQAWDVIYARHGDEMLRMISEPDSYRPGGGETTFEMRDRVLRWHKGLPAGGLTIAVTHGGPIAALLGTQQQLPVSQWAGLIPACGQFVPVHPRVIQLS